MATLPEIRQQYPQYRDLSDQQLADRLYQRHYSDMPRADFDRRIGLQGQSWGELAGDVGRHLARGAERITPAGQLRQLLTGYTPFERQMVQGATFSFGDELEAVAGTLRGGDYDTAVTDIRRGNEAFARDNPGTALTANLAGGIAPWTGGPLGSLARWSVAGRTLPRTMARSGAVGAGAGAVAGFGAGEGGLEERLESAGTGGLVGGGVGAVLPPVISGVARGAGAVSSLFQRARPRQITEPPPVQPAGAPELQGPSPTGPPVGGVSFVDNRTQEALNSQEGALRMIGDWILSAGGTIDDVERAWQAVQRSGRLHSSGQAINAQTLAEIYPPLQRLLRAGASGYREVGQDASRFLSARHTGVLPAGADEAALAQRGIPTRERFLAGRTGEQAERELGTSFGAGLGNVVPTGQLARIVDATKRLFRIRDTDFHGHAANAKRTVDQIVDSLERTSLPARKAAFAAGDMVDLRPTIRPILETWGARAYEDAPLIGTVVRRALRQFYTTGGGKDAQIVGDLRRFDRGKRALDDLIRANLGTEAGRTLQTLKRELLVAVDGIKQGRVGELYARARGIYSGGMEERDILTRFRDAWKNDPDAVVADYDALRTAAHQKLARLGIVWGVEDQNLGRRVTQDATLAFDTDRAQRLFTAIGGRMRRSPSTANEVMRRYGTYIGGEQEAVRGTAKTVIGGSMTDRNVQDALAMGGMEIVQNVQSFSNIWRGSTSLFEVGRAMLEKIVDRAFGLSADRAREMSRMLLTANPEEITAIINRLRMIMPADRMTRFNELMKAAQSAAPGVSSVGGTAAAAPQPAFL